jgi:hypothetical protein
MKNLQSPADKKGRKRNPRERDSNMELLRIVSMILVLIVHANFKSLDAPSQLDIEVQTSSSFVRFLCESIAIICVNVFICISGWYGIRPNAFRLIEFIFQILFIRILLYFILYMFGLTERWNITDWIRLFTFHKGLWFVNAYIILYIFAPVLNSFVNLTTRHQLKFFLLMFFSAQSIFGFINSDNWFYSGSSPLSFFGLYLLARYVRLYPNKHTTHCKYYDILIYLITVLLTTFIAFFSVKFFNRGGLCLYAYSSPIVILSSFYFFLFFTKITFKSTIINWIAISAFSIYIVHCDPLLFYPYYLETIRSWFANDTLILFFIHIIVLICSIFVLSIMLDKIRIFVWKKIIQLFRK